MPVLIPENSKYAVAAASKLPLQVPRLVSKNPNRHTCHSTVHRTWLPFQQPPTGGLSTCHSSSKWNKFMKLYIFLCRYLFCFLKAAAKNIVTGTDSSGGVLWSNIGEKTHGKILIFLNGYCICECFDNYGNLYPPSLVMISVNHVFVLSPHLSQPFVHLCLKWHPCRPVARSSHWKLQT